MSDTDRSSTKYGDQIADHEWAEPEPDGEAASRTSIDTHTLDVIYTTDPQADGGYGREKYSAIVQYDDETGEPYVLYVIEHRWKGNYWRDVTDWDWRDVPEPVRQEIAAALPVDSPDALDGGTRVIPEGGESRWEKYHKPRVDARSGDEMFGTSFLRDGIKSLERAAEAFDEGSKGERLAERLVSVTRDVLEQVETQPEDGDRNGE